VKVSIKDLSVAMEVKNKGIEFEVRDTKANQHKHLGDFYVTRTGVEWCAGKKPQGNGTNWSWRELIKEMEG